MINKWRNLSSGDRQRVLVVMLSLLVGGYGLLLYPLTQKALQQSESMIARRIDRIEKRTRLDAAADANPRALRRQVEELDQELARLAASLEQLGGGFAPLDSGLDQQRLLLELSTLARQTGVELLSIGRGGTPAAPGNANQPAAAPAVPPVDPRLGRPLVKLSAHADYWQLLDFLDGLAGLSYHVSVMQLTVRSRQLDAAADDRGSRDSTLPPGALALALVLAI